MRIAILGLGYVGTGVGRRLAEEGHTVVGYDPDPSRGRRIDWETVEHYSDGPTGRRFGPFTIQGSTDPAVIADAEVAIIAVPTPLADPDTPDHSHVEAAVELIRLHCRDSGMLVVLESTVSPGKTRELVAAKLPGHDVAFSPERIDPGNERHRFANTPKLVSGVTAAARARAAELYRGICSQVVEVESPEVAEIAKLWENTFRAVGIALANDIAVYCRAIGVDPFDVLDAAATKPFGFMPFKPGPGVGGHCIPVDPVFLLDAMESVGRNSPIIESAQTRNTHEWIRVAGNVLDEVGGSLIGKRTLLYGVAYKAGTGDTRESPAKPILQQLLKCGAEVSFEDPYVSEFCGLPASEPEDYGAFDCVVVLADHPELDVERLRREAKAIVDTRGVLRCSKSPSTQASFKASSGTSRNTAPVSCQTLRATP